MNLSKLQKPAIIAHRGFKRLYPENTLVAFDAAIQAGTHMIELDVTFSRDRKLVVIHDDTLDRTTNGSGTIQTKDLARIKTLDAGSWFDPSFAGEKVPTLDEVLDACGNRTLVNIEIKASAYEAEHRPDGIEQQVVLLIQSRNLRNSVLISSFEPEILVRIANFDPTIFLGLLTETYDPEMVLHWSGKLDLYSWNPHAQGVAQNLIQKMHEQNIRVFPYTVNSVFEARALMAAKVDGFFTDDPALLIREFF